MFRKRTVSGYSNKKLPTIDFFINPITKKYRFPVLYNDSETFLSSFDIIKEQKRKESIELKIGIIDSGIIMDHPIFKGKVEDWIDYTDEGINDKSGHGTMVAYLFLNTLSSLNNNINVKFYIAIVRGENDA